MKKKIIIPVIAMVWMIIGICVGYIFYISVDMKTTANVSGVVYQLFIIGCVMSGIIYSVLNTIIKDILGPLSEFTYEAENFEKGVYTHKLRHYEIDEVQNLGNAFDRMGEKLHRTIRKLNYEKSKMESVVNNLDEGLIILEQDGHVREMNKWAKNYFEVQKFEPRKYLAKEILRHPKCKDLIEKAMATGERVSCEVEWGKDLLGIEVGAIEKANVRLGYVISVRDVTTTRKLEEMRYQFVSNVTHELKTPLTSIQGFVETLKGGALENPKVAYRFLDIIDVEAQRLYRLIQDILLLSEIENMTNLGSEAIEIGDIVEEVITLMTQDAQRKNIGILFDEVNKVVIEGATRDHMKQLILNLVSNGVKYTDEGQVIVRTFMKDDKKVIQVEDTGIGIPKECQERIFERFYRVDKSRSRQSGGTGLGLSIVKHIVNLYKGTIEVQSVDEKGTLFTIEF
ncbi:MAG: ATP-binding protein [Cellulosilyticaceae bacterium]